MSGDLDDFDALFEEISAQRTETVAPAIPAATAAPIATPTPPTVTPAAATPPSAVTEDNAEDASDKPMYERLGGIVRLLHDSLRELGYDRSLTDVASQISDAQGRLEYVATLTEQAANKVLNAIDIGMPEQDVLSKTAKNMDARWGQLFDGKLSVEEFKTLASDSREFSQKVAEVTEAEKARLLEIMMAQDFQDLTGQVIKKIIAMAQDMENQLLGLLVEGTSPEKKAEMDSGLLNGPVIKADGRGDIVTDQGQVDDLLESLGF